MSVVINKIQHSSLLNPIKNKSVYHLAENHAVQYLDQWIIEHPEVFKNGIFYTKNMEEARLIIIFAGTCAGKTTFVTKTLPKHGKVYFNCSRKMIKEQQKDKQIKGSIKSKEKELTHFSENNNLVVGTSWDLINQDFFREAKKADYIVVDEAHHITADTFCEAPNYLFELLNSIGTTQKVILMTACAEYFENIIDNNIRGGDYFDLHINPVCVLDLRESCKNLYPQEIKIISPRYAKEMITSFDANSYQAIYYCTSAKQAYNSACEAIMEGKNAVAITSSKNLMAPTINKYIKNIVKEQIVYEQNAISSKRDCCDMSISSVNMSHVQLNKLINFSKNVISVEKTIKNEYISEEIDIIYTTSRLREGINICSSGRRLIVISELIDPVSIVQVAGRIRNNEEQYNFDCYYLVVQPKKHLSEEEQLRKLDKSDSYYCKENVGSYNRFFNEMIEDVSSPSITSTPDTVKKIAAKRKISQKDANRLIVMAVKKMNANKIYKVINMKSEFVGQWFLKPNRIDSEDIYGYNLELNNLWFINYQVLNNEIYRSYPSNIEFAERLSEKVKTIFPKASVEIIKTGISLTTQEIDNCYTYDTEEVKKILGEYANRDGHYFRRSEYDDLKFRLIAAHFINSHNNIGSAIKEIGFHGEWKNSKRLQYKITKSVNNVSK